MIRMRPDKELDDLMYGIILVLAVIVIVCILDSIR